MIRFIDEHRNRFSVEFICQTLNIHREGDFITSRGYRQSKARGLSARSLRDAALIEYISEIYADNYEGARFFVCGCLVFEPRANQGVDHSQTHRRRHHHPGRQGDCSLMTNHTQARAGPDPC